MQTLASVALGGLLILLGAQPGDEAFLKKELAGLRGYWNVVKGAAGNQDLNTQLSSADDAKPEGDLSQAAKEKAAAEKVVAELGRQDFAKLAKEDLIRVSLAYNELGDLTRALDAINHVPESYLAEKGKLIDKAIALTNVNSRAGADKVNVLKELVFLDRCIDRRYPNPGMWHWRKAKLLCRNSVSSLPNAEPSIVDREQFEYAYETLERAFAVEPKLLALPWVRAERRFIAEAFPILHSEPRFKKLLEM